MSRYVVLVTGSRRQQPMAQLWERLREYAHPIIEHVVVVHGDALGVDTCARIIADRLGFHQVRVPYFGHLGPRGGNARNALLVDLTLAYQKHGYLAKCLAYPDKDSRGTRNCIAQVRGTAIPLEVTELG